VQIEKNYPIQAHLPGLLTVATLAQVVVDYCGQPQPNPNPNHMFVEKGREGIIVYERTSHYSNKPFGLPNYKINFISFHSSQYKSLEVICSLS